MVEFLYTFLKRNNLKANISDVIYQKETHFGIQFIKKDNYGREIAKTDPIVVKYDKRPSPNQFVKDLIDSFISGNVVGDFKGSMIRLIGEEEFSKFLDIVCEDDVKSTVISPIKGKIVLRITIDTSTGVSHQKYICSTFSEFEYYLKDTKHVKEVTIESADIREISFFQPKYINLDRIKFIDCKIKSLMGFPKSEVGKVSFLNCRIHGFTNNPVKVKEVEINKCFCKIRPQDQFLTSIDTIIISSGKVVRLSYLLPKICYAKEIYISSTDVKMMHGFPQCPNLEKLEILDSKNLITLYGLPKKLPKLKTFEISGNQSLKTINSFPKVPNLQKLILRSSFFKKGSIRDLPKVIDLDISSNDSSIFSIFPQCDFVTMLRMNNIKNEVDASFLEKFPIAMEFEINGTQIKLSPNVSPSVVVTLARHYLKSEFRIVGSNRKRECFGKITRHIAVPFVDSDLFSSRFDFFYNYNYCTGNLLKAVVEYYKKNGECEWAKNYIQSEFEPEWYHSCIMFLKKSKNVRIGKQLIQLLESKYEGCDEIYDAEEKTKYYT